MVGLMCENDNSDSNEEYVSQVTTDDTVPFKEKFKNLWKIT